MSTTYTLYNYFRSSTSVRVRIALALKGLDYEYVGVPLLEGAQKDAGYLDTNPQGLVPSLVVEGQGPIAQSLAIIEYLDEVHPVPALLPTNAFARARVRSLAQLVACDIHPLNNLRVLQTLKREFEADKDSVAQWFTLWATEGFAALEQRLTSEAQTGLYCHGNEPGLADICMYAQVLNNRRFAVDPKPFPKIMSIAERCAKHEAFQAGEPDSAPDAR